MTLDEVLEAFAAHRLDTVAVVGAVARNAWAPPRATADLDLAVAANAGAIEALDRALAHLGYRRVREQRVDPSDELPDIIIYRVDASGLRQVDVLVAKTEFESQALERAVEIPVVGHPIRVVPSRRKGTRACRPGRRPRGRPRRGFWAPQARASTTRRTPT